MSDLIITIISITEQDYDGVDETTKQVTGTIDLIPLQPQRVEEDIITDTDCKSNYRTLLTNLGFTWTTENGL